MNLAGGLELGARELVAFVGGGGKTTTMLALAPELADSGSRVLLTTTTMIRRDQTGGYPVYAGAETVPDPPPPVAWLLSGGTADKATGPGPATVDRLFEEGRADFVLVEADGARGRPLKAPGEGEPVVPGAATLTVVMMGIDAVGCTVGEASHRVERVRVLTGLRDEDRLRARDCAAVLGHPAGGLQGVPAACRVVVALNKVRPGRRLGAAEEIARRLRNSARIAGVVGIAENRAGGVVAVRRLV